MKTILLLAPMGSIHTRFNLSNIAAIQQLGYKLTILANFDVCVGAEQHNSVYAEKWRKEGIEVISFPFVRHSFLKNLPYVWRLRKFLYERNFDIIHTHTETGGLILRLCGKVPGKKIYTIHGMSFWKGGPFLPRLIYKPIEKFICSGMDFNLGMNQEEVEFLHSWNENSSEYVHGIGVDISRFQLGDKLEETKQRIREEFGIRDNDLLIVSIGELDDNKNHKVVIKALSEIEKKNFKYVICGVGPNKEMLQNLAQDYGLSEKVILAGYRSDVPAILNAADIFVFPSFHEGMPVSALEAMASGLPIICSQIRGNVDIVKHGDNGYLFAPDNDLALAICLQNLMSNDSKRFFMGKKNQELVKAFSREAVVKELKKIYR